jgi:aspartyl-tRNA(Asn)/glutamyl-tRNA(Gln) amidotransferase subunit B
LPVELDDALIENIASNLPELPDSKRARFASEYGLNEADAEQLTASIELADYFEKVAKACGDAKLTANWINVELTAALNKADIELSQSPVTADLLAGLLVRITDKTISGKIAKQVFEAVWNGEGSADEVIEAKGLKQITDTGAIEKIIDEVIANNPQQVENYKTADASKRPKMLGFFVGQVMKASQGKANPQQVNQLLNKKLG